jgi:hypothetical protein
MAGNLPRGDRMHEFVYVRDMQRGRTKLVSKTNSGQPAENSDVFGQSVSSSGTRIIFESADNDLPHADGTTEHIYVRNMKTGRVSLVDRNSRGKPANDSSYYPSVWQRTLRGLRFGRDEPAAGRCVPAGVRPRPEEAEDDPGRSKQPGQI